MIPVTRKELYLAKIIGEDVDIPETAKTREELFFLKILDNFSKIPEPITREELFLAKISGQDVELPEPKTRLELFLAKAAGVEIETPTPITREEIFWSNYSAIVDFEVEGIPPLTYKAVKGTLKNYRIYGNIVGGAGVGELEETGEHAGEYKVPVTVSNGADTQTIPIYLTEQIKKVGDEAEYIDYGEQKQHRVRKNLFDFSSWADSLVYTTRISYNITGDIITLNATSNDAFTFPYSHATGGFEIPVNPNTTYILSWQSDNNNSGLVYVFENGVLSGNQMHSVNNSSRKSMKFTTLPNTRFLTFRLGVSNIGDSIVYFNIQLELGSVITPYEPYIQNTELDVTLPALLTLSGTNTLTVGTEVQPSNVYIKYEGAR